MNVMQKVTAAASLLCVAVLLATAALTDSGNPNWMVLTVASGLVGTALVAVFARGDMTARLQKGTVVLALAGAALTLAIAPLDTSRVKLRLARYPELRGHLSVIEGLPGGLAMDAADSVIAEHLLADYPVLRQWYGRCVVAFARSRAVPVETVCAAIQRESLALCQQFPLPEHMPRTSRRGRRVGGGLPQWVFDSLLSLREEQFRRRLDTVLAGVGGHAKAVRRLPDARIPNWPARAELAGCELLAGLAVVIALGLLRRTPRKADETHDAA